MYICKYAGSVSVILQYAARALVPLLYTEPILQYAARALVPLRRSHVYTYGAVHIIDLFAELALLIYLRHLHLCLSVEPMHIHTIIYTYMHICAYVYIHMYVYICIYQHT